MNRRTRIFGIILLSVSALLLSTVKVIDRTDIEETDYFKKMMSVLDSVSFQHIPGGQIKAGWSKVSITPDRSVPLAGYGLMNSSRSEGINDSLFVRTLAFDNNKTRIFIITLDMLIAPPSVVQAVNKKLQEFNIHPDLVLWTAIHSHNSIGGWARGFIGRRFAGNFDESLVRYLSEQVLESIRLSLEGVKDCEIGFTEVCYPHIVYNRLVYEEGEIDGWIKILKIKAAAQIAIFTTYSAHPTSFKKNYLYLTGDYPSYYNTMLEMEKGIDFSVFAAGAVGSMGANTIGMVNEWKALFLARHLLHQVIDAHVRVQTSQETELGYLRIPVFPGKPQLKLSKNLCFRPWLFKWLFGNIEPYIQAIRIGRTLILGFPCDFSGELAVNLYEEAQKQGINLIVTSFNGDYIGYLTKDAWYDLDSYETRIMSWFGPYSGKYFSIISKRIIGKAALSE